MTPDLAIIAEHDGLCCLCGKYVHRGRSRIAPLPVAMPPDPELCSYHAGRWYVAHAPAHVRRRRWGHINCVQRFDQQYASDEARLLAEDWAAELRAIKRRADANDWRRHGRKAVR